MEKGIQIGIQIFYVALILLHLFVSQKKSLQVKTNEVISSHNNYLDILIIDSITLTAQSLSPAAIISEAAIVSA